MGIDAFDCLTWKVIVPIYRLRKGGIMGQKNNVLNSYMSKPERIQSVLEYYINEKLPEDWASKCEDRMGFYPVRNTKGKVTYRQRDILKQVKTETGSYLLGIENQENINLIFPWRLMQMDCLAYERQIEERQEKNKNQDVKYKERDSIDAIQNRGAL